MDDITFTMHEKDSYDYVYIDEENNVHLLCPLVGGDTIGPDNTRKSTYELRKFFGNYPGADRDSSALDVLVKYRRDLQDDIALLESFHDNTKNDLLKKKRERLEQINVYLYHLEKVSRRIDFGVDYSNERGVYPTLVKKLLNDKGNCVSILLSPKKPDGYLNGAGYVFSVKRKGDYSKDISGQALRKAFSNMKEIKATSNQEMVLQEVEKELGRENIKIDDDFIDRTRDVLQNKIKTLLGKDVDLIIPQKSTKKDQKVDMRYFAETLLSEEGEEFLPKEVANTILSACLSDDFWASLASSHFKEAATLPKLKRSERLSLLTQFFLAEVNVFCYAQLKTRKNFGEVLDNNTNNIRDNLAVVIENALVNDLNIEQALINCINQNMNIFGLLEGIKEDEAKKIIDRFNMEYEIVKDSPHMDEFFLFSPDSKFKWGSFVNHKNRISFHFAHFALEQTPNHDFFKKHLEAFKDRKGNRLSAKNNIVQQSINIKSDNLVAVMKNNPSMLIMYAITSKDPNFVDDMIQKLSKANLIHTLLNISESDKLSTAEKNSNRKKILKEIRNVPSRFTWIVRTLSFMATYKITARLARFILRVLNKEKYEELYKPRIELITSADEEGIKVKGTSKVISDILTESISPKPNQEATQKSGLEIKKEEKKVVSSKHYNGPQKLDH